MWEIGPDGCVKVGRWTLVFPAVFAGQTLHAVSQGKLALANWREVIGFYVNLKGTPEEGTVDVMGLGLLQPVE